MLVTLKNMFVNKTKLSGEPYIDKNNKAYIRVVLDTEEQGKVAKVFYGEDMIPSWSKGDQVNVEITQNGNFKNWDFPKVPKGESPYSMQPNNGAMNTSQKHNPYDYDTPAPTQKYVQEEAQDDNKQERILRGMCGNQAAVMLDFDSLNVPIDELADLHHNLTKEIYRASKSWYEGN